MIGYTTHSCNWQPYRPPIPKHDLVLPFFWGGFVLQVKAGGFHWVPGARGTNPDLQWPPRGTHVEFDHTVPCSDVAAGNGQLVATVVLELYDETSAFGKRVRLQHNCSAPLYVYNMSVSINSLKHDRSVTASTDAAVAEGGLARDHDSTGQPIQLWVNNFLRTGGLPFYGPGLSDWRDDSTVFESYFVAEVAHDVAFEVSPVARGMSRCVAIVNRPPCRTGDVSVCGDCEPSSLSLVPRTHHTRCPYADI